MTIAAVIGDKGGSVVTIAADARLTDAVGLLAKHRIGALPVVEADRLVGIISERDLVYCLERVGAAALDKPVAELMSAPAITVEPDTAVISALAVMTRRRIRHLPVVAGNALLGIVSIGDLVKHRMERIEAEAEAMRSYIQGA